VLIGVVFFVALGLEPAISRLVSHKLPRWAAVTLVGATVTAAIRALVEQARQVIDQAPHYLQQAQDHSTLIGRLNERFRRQQRITDAIYSFGASGVAGMVKAGTAVIGAVSDVVIVAVMTAYFLADMPRIRAPRSGWYRTPDGHGRSSLATRSSPR